MKLIPQPLIIGEDDDYKKAVIDRSEFGNFLTKLVRSTPEPLVIAIDGRWGEGKTTFVKIWQNQLECRGHWANKADTDRTPALYIDAFKMEATEDIFISLVAELDSFVRSECGNLVILESLKSKAINLAVKLLPVAAKAAVNFITLNALSNTGFDQLELNRDAISKTLSEQAEKLLADRLESLASQKQIIDEFRNKLTELPVSIENNPSKQLVIIVDELDRCSPKYAVEFLEKIKHFFSTDRIKFVLVINKNQLEESIRSVYGQGIIASEYLQKFIDVEARLPNDPSEFSRSEIPIFCQSLFERHEFENESLAMEFNRFVSDFAYIAKLTLRQIQKIYIRFALVKASNPMNFSNWDPVWHPFVAYMCIVFVLDQEQFKEISNRLNSGKRVQTFFFRNFRGAERSPYMSEMIPLIEHICMNADEFNSSDNSRIKNLVGLASGEQDRIRLNNIATICRVLSTFDLR